MFQRRTASFFIHCPPRFITIEKWSSALLQIGCHYSNIKNVRRYLLFKILIFLYIIQTTYMVKILRS